MYLFFDVETRGLFGEAFAVGYVLTNDKGREVLSGIHCCPDFDAKPNVNDDPDATETFLEQHVLPTLPYSDCFTTRGVRDKFRQVWRDALRLALKNNQELRLFSDVPYPCEAQFLLQCRHDEPSLVVYPLLDVASVLFARGMDPIGTYPRHDNEKPAHNPLNDARQSARMFFTALATDTDSTRKGEG